MIGLALVAVGAFTLMKNKAGSSSEDAKLNEVKYSTYDP